MQPRKRKPFDLPIDGLDENCMTVADLLDAFQSCKTDQPETARTFIEAACYQGNPRAKLLYSKFLRTTLGLSMTQAERYCTAERHLKELLNLLDLPDRFVAEVAMELGCLYVECLYRPVGALAMYLLAKRHGANVESAHIQRVRRQLAMKKGSEEGRNPEDALRLGQELLYLPETETSAETFLKEAVAGFDVGRRKGERAAETLYAVACLALGEFYEAQSRTNPAYCKEAAAMFAEARKYGYPEYMRVGTRGGFVRSRR